MELVITRCLLNGRQGAEQAVSNHPVAEGESELFGDNPEVCNLNTQLKETEACSKHWGEALQEMRGGDEMDWRCALGAKQREEEPAGSRRTEPQYTLVYTLVNTLVCTHW